MKTCVTMLGSELVRECGTWRMKRGTRQGDSTGGDIFNDVYTGAVDKYRDKRQDHQMIIQHDDHEVAVDTEVFVDDILEMTVGDDIEELHERLATNTGSLVQCLAEVGSELEPTKEVAFAVQDEDAPNSMPKQCYQATLQMEPKQRLPGTWGAGSI